MTDDELLRIFDDRIRANAGTDTPGSRVERDGLVVRQIGAPGGWSAVLHSELDEATADAAIAAQVAHFTAADLAFEWKLYSHDSPADLGARLTAAGFAAGEPETLMVAEITDLAGLSAQLPDGVTLRPVATEADVQLVAEVHDAAFGSGGDRIARHVLARLAEDPDTVWTWLAMAGDTPVCAARMEVHSGTEFASLWGGGTVREWRGKGIYRALVAYRAAVAASLGCRFLQVDASDQSRPILARLGFRALAVTTPYDYEV